jgi:hypothetical protein
MNDESRNVIIVGEANPLKGKCQRVNSGEAREKIKKKKNI